MSEPNFYNSSTKPTEPEPVMGKRRSESIEQYAARVVPILQDSPQLLEEHHRQEIAAIVDVLETRAMSWKQIAARHYRRYHFDREESDRVQKIADDLAAAIRK